MKMKDDIQHRLAAIAILIAALAVMALLAAAPHVDAFAVAKRIETSRTVLSKLSALAGRVSKLQDQNARFRQSSDQRKLLLSGSTTGIAGAELQRFLLDRLAHNNGTATSVLVQAPEPDEYFIRISTSLSVRIDITGLRNLLHELETGMPLLFITDLSVQPVAANAQAGASRILDVRMKVSGYVGKDGAS